MGKKKNAPAGAAAGTSSSKVIDNPKTLNSDLVDEVAEHRKPQPDSLTTERDIADSIERESTFQAPLGSDPVVVDLLGMGKGIAWVNSQSLGKFWPSYLTWSGGCSPCDYKGPFQSNGCQSGCRELAQRWFHVPRSFLKAGEPNTLVLFKEAGGDPSQVNLQTVIVGIVCANVVEGNILTLSCQGPQKFFALQVDSFGDPHGTCGSFQIGTCNVDNAYGIVRQACVGQTTCSILVDEKTFGSSECNY